MLRELFPLYFMYLAEEEPESLLVLGLSTLFLPLNDMCLFLKTFKFLYKIYPIHQLLE